ncbi:PPOX class F420-dependent oxidoreductase [Tsukamurella tyrosinosolvens]|uniref:PPOX class probable F420-dependent enzyme n=1 Tax=Tsukamurella tyrosinosolvens TaxID=57704 RepID=A0A1H5B2W7_TSUTY|nr:PPOX class F420-dependent oxidoreductase [Tsukamurella tyrosinosolvens]AUN42312.1 PPOX class F420-dependent enzyme [Tsukamurella tyrosinosolvens]KXO95192.1 F420-dependent protein [Tsukamurella tyrosinosolvens]KXP07574.1 F420-dependent protein [Tsukamurella tyrosinosolvens]KZL98777.1 F420-dependent protein [Tsukamurella tyrosinosolvens]MCA4994999.1 PPOX class F420-dependent oxidoreductase [Tsukamurella tyrosinosolvens]
MGTNQRGQIQMTEAEIEDFLERSRTATIATLGASGAPHLVAMWYAVIDGDLWIETKAKSQKVVNLRRNPVMSASIEAGQSYDQLRGVTVEGTAEIVEDEATVRAVCEQVYERYFGPYSDELKPAIDEMMKKRVAVRLRGDRVRSWDHRKLGMPGLPVAGSTAAYL